MLIGSAANPEGDAGVYVLAGLLSLIPCLALGLKVGWSVAQTTYFGTDWWLFTKGTLVVTGCAIPLAYLAAIPISEGLRWLWRAIRRR